jgi:hypothetical protein
MFFQQFHNHVVGQIEENIKASGYLDKFFDAYPDAVQVQINVLPYKTIRTLSFTFTMADEVFTSTQEFAYSGKKLDMINWNHISQLGMFMNMVPMVITIGRIPGSEDIQMRCELDDTMEIVIPNSYYAENLDSE